VRLDRPLAGALGQAHNELDISLGISLSIPLPGSSQSTSEITERLPFVPISGGTLLYPLHHAGRVGVAEARTPIEDIEPLVLKRPCTDWPNCLTAPRPGEWGHHASHALLLLRRTI
jgi:hypothetical protein